MQSAMPKDEIMHSGRLLYRLSSHVFTIEHKKRVTPTRIEAMYASTPAPTSCTAVMIIIIRHMCNLQSRFESGQRKKELERAFVAYLEPSDGVEESDVDAGELLEEEKQEQYHHRLPSGRLQECSELRRHAAVFAILSLVQFHFIFVHDRVVLHIRGADFPVILFVLVQPTNRKSDA